MSYRKYRIRRPHFPDLETVKAQGFRVYEFGSLFNPHIKIPHGVQVDGYRVMREYDPGTLNPDSDGFITKVEWDAYTWNAPLNSGHKKPDPDADPKPTWEELLEWVAENDIFKLHFAAEGYPEESSGPMAGADTRRVRALLTDGAFARGEQNIHGGEMSHIAGLIHLLETTTQAGRVFPAVVLRDADSHQSVTLHLESEAREMVGGLSDRENAVESAHNQVVGEYAQLASVRDDFSRPDDERLEAGRAALKFAEQYESKLAAAIQSYDPNALPEDLPGRRRKLIELLEAEATGHQQWVKGALTQQAIDNWAACVEVDEALKEISLECAAGSIAIANVRDRIWKKVSGKWEVANPRTGRVDHEGDDEPTADIGSEGEHYRQTNTGQDIAKAAYEKAVQAIRAVSPINVPEITYAVSGRKVTIRAEHPDTDPPIRGQVTIDSSGVGSTDGSNIVGKITASSVGPSKDSDPIISWYEFADDYGGKNRITLTARNVCGPAEIVLDLEVTDNGASAGGKPDS